MKGTYVEMGSDLAFAKVLLVGDRSLWARQGILYVC